MHDLSASQSDTRPLKSKSSKTSFSEKVDLVSTGIDAIDASDQDPTASIQSKVTLSEDCEVTPDPDIRPSPEESVVSRQMEEDSHSANCMTFHNVSYEVSGLKRFKWVTKTILSSVRYVIHVVCEPYYAAHMSLFILYESAVHAA